MAKRAFVISTDLIMAIGIVMIMMVMLISPTPYEWSGYSYVSDAITILDQRGILDNQAYMESELQQVLPYESYRFTLIDFGPFQEYDEFNCTTDADCAIHDPYLDCIVNMCGRNSFTIETGDYQEYSSNPMLYCSAKMISEGACKPSGDLSQVTFVDSGDDELVDNFYIARLEVAD